MFQTDVIRPRHAAIKQGIFDKNKEPFGVRRKDFWEANELSTGKLLSANFRKQLLHEPDGLIFQPDILVRLGGVKKGVMRKRFCATRLC